MQNKISNKYTNMTNKDISIQATKSKATVRQCICYIFYAACLFYHNPPYSSGHGTSTRVKWLGIYGAIKHLRLAWWHVIGLWKGGTQQEQRRVLSNFHITM